MQIHGAVAVQPHADFELVPLRLDDLRPDEARIRMVAAGICHADVIARDQVYPVPLPAVLGHEGAGVVEAVGADVVDLAVGDHVVLSFNYCGRCRFCSAGYPGNCRHTAAYNFGGYRPDGTSPLSTDDGPVAGWFFGQSSFATHANVSARLAVKVDRDVPLALLAPLGCGVITGVGAVWNVLRPAPGDSFAVFGVGAVGLSALMAAVKSGCSPVIAVDVHPSRLETARSLGATHVMDAASTSLVDDIRAITGGGVDCAVDAAGATSAFRQMLDSLGTRGHGVLVGAPTPGDLLPLDLNPSLGAGRRVSFVLEGDAHPQVFIPRLVRLIKNGDLDLEPIIRTFPFHRINAAVASAEQGVAIKPVLLFE